LANALHRRRGETVDEEGRVEVDLEHEAERRGLRAHRAAWAIEAQEVAEIGRHEIVPGQLEEPQRLRIAREVARQDDGEGEALLGARSEPDPDAGRAGEQAAGAARERILEG